MKVFITGVSSGIGRVLAKLLVADGHEVWGIARRQELLESLKQELDSDKFFYSCCDVADPEQVSTTISAMQQRNFLPDVVLLNSAVLERDLENGFSFDQSQKAFIINYFGALIWVEKFLTKFIERGAGKFIAVSSTSAFRPDPKSLSLPASKAALYLAFRSLRLRFSPKIKFTTVFFAPVATAIIPEFTTNTGGKKYFFVMTAEQAAAKLKKTIFGKKSVYYFPFWLALLFRLFLIFPDSFFSKFTQYLKK